MMKVNGHLKLVLIALAALAVLCVPWGSSVMAQCAMCRAGIAGGSNGSAFTKSFNAAVLVLLAPPVTIFCSIFIVAYKHRKSRQEAMREEEDESFDDE
jgi:hypothetical protein